MKMQVGKIKGLVSDVWSLQCRRRFMYTVQFLLSAVQAGIYLIIRRGRGDKYKVY